MTLKLKEHLWDSMDAVRSSIYRTSIGSLKKFVEELTDFLGDEVDVIREFNFRIYNSLQFKQNISSIRLYFIDKTFG